MFLSDINYDELKVLQMLLSASSFSFLSTHEENICFHTTVEVLFLWLE